MEKSNERTPSSYAVIWLRRTPWGDTEQADTPPLPWGTSVGQPHR